MIELPADFRSWDGDANPWRAGVPALAQKYVEKWSLQQDGVVMVGNIAVVVPVRTADDTPAVLRLAPRTPTSDHDWLALQMWDGAGAVRMFEHHAQDGVLLLERVDHTRNLDALPIDEAVVVAGTLRARLSRPAPAGIRTLESEAQAWAQELADASGLPKRTTDEAVGLCRELGPGANQHLVNEDQHYHNILAAEREPWLVIDPMVIAGDREHGLATLIWGRLEESTTERILDALIEIERLDRHRARAWTFVYAVLKWSKSQGRVAHNCATIANTLAGSA